MYQIMSQYARIWAPASSPLCRTHGRPVPECRLSPFTIPAASNMRFPKLLPIFCCFFVIALHATPSLSADPAEPSKSTSANVENAVVKVFSTVRNPDLSRPWTKQAPTEITGSGVVIEGKRILTNAHVVLYASQVQVQANQAGDKISATE